MGKARVTPMKHVAIPRLELTAALVSAKISAFLKRELEFEDIQEYFWTDSKVALGYVTNDARRFHVFVANRVQQIKELSEGAQWRHIPTDKNSADEASRGLSAKQFVESSRWICGPAFLREMRIPDLDIETQEILCDENDPEVKRATTGAIRARTSHERFQYFSDWYRLKREVAVFLRLKSFLQDRKVKINRCQCPAKSIDEYEPVKSEDLEKAENVILKLVQRESFSSDIKVLESVHKSGKSTRQTEKDLKRVLKGTSSIHRLDPFLDDNGIPRVGGRLQRAEFTSNVRHPAVPRTHHITTLVIRHFHQKTGHQGRGMTTNQLRANGFWVTGCSSAVLQYISKCVEC
ncbi:uncharacterized protein LOC135464892 [Liolophura sinensis]|uniref:uncharacterized protein LOC135464892 n=1 Tax=Liolophura sinensis TaxID=3198878 RepID=UPI003159829D